MLHLANSHATVLWLFTCVLNSSIALIPTHPLGGAGGGRRSWVSLQAMLWSASQMGAVLICWEVYITDVTRQTSKHTLPEPGARGARHAHSCQSVPVQESRRVMEGVCSEGRARLRSPANVSVWPCCIFSLSSWLGQCCLPTTSNALTLFRCISKDSSVRTET